MGLVLLAKKMSIEGRVWQKIDKNNPNGCWVWTGAKARGGYGHINIGGKFPSAHRVVYEMIKGEIPEGLLLDHLCRNPSCVNPDHLEPVTHKENLKRGIGISSQNSKKTHCPQGHEYTEENTYVSKRNQRTCKQCAREQQIARRKRLRGESA